MMVNAYSNNKFHIEGYVSGVREYCPGRVANVTVAVDMGKDKDENTRPKQYIQTKSFVPASYRLLKKGMRVSIEGHVAPNKYEKNGEMIYTIDLVDDYITFMNMKTHVKSPEKNAEM